MTISPCYTCKQENKEGSPLRWCDKNNPTCENCHKRIEYVGSMGRMTHGMPHSMTDLSGQNGSREAKKNFKTNKNISSREKKTMKEKTPEEIVVAEICAENNITPELLVSRRPGQKGTDARRQISEKLNGRVGVKRIAELIGVSSTIIYGYRAAEKKNNIEKKPSAIIDLGKQPDLLKKIKEAAKEEMRTLENQVVWLLTRSLDVRKIY